MQDTVTQRFLNVYEELKKRGDVDSQKEFADILGFREQYFTGYRAGTRKVNNSVINNLVRTYGVSLPFLMAGTGKMFESENKAGEPGSYSSNTARGNNNLQSGGNMTANRGGADTNNELAVLKAMLAEKEQAIVRLESEVAFLREMLQHRK